jgi:hypothetical protein
MQAKVMILMRIANLKRRLSPLYTQEEADIWLNSASTLLDGNRPVDLLSDDAGYLEVDHVIDQMLDDVYL